MSNNIDTSTVTVLGFDPRLVRYGSIFLLVVGTFGNIISFIVFINESLRKSSTFRYLAFLSLMDLLVLYSGLVDLFLTIEYNGTFSLRNLNPITCRLHTFVTYWSQHSSSWILSFISVDRAIATNCIKFARKFCTPRSAEYVVGIILVFTALLNFHELIYLRLQEVDAIEYNEIDTTMSSYHTSTLSLETSSSYGLDISNKSQSKRSIQSISSFCDKPPWSYLCSRHKRDVSTTNLTDSPSLPIEKMFKCAALKDSRYEYFWDHVSFSFN